MIGRIIMYYRLIWQWRRAALFPASSEVDGRNIRRTDVIHRIYHEYPSRNRETGEEIGKIVKLTTLKQVRQPTKIVRLVCKLFAGVGWAGQSNIFLTAKTCLSTINCNSKNFVKSNIPIYSDKIEVVNIYINSSPHNTPPPSPSPPTPAPLRK